MSREIFYFFIFFQIKASGPFRNIGRRRQKIFFPFYMQIFVVNR